MRFNKYPLLLLFTVLSGKCIAQGERISCRNPKIYYTGRVAFTDSAAILSWTATSLKINFSGSGIAAVLKDERGENSYNVIVDGKIVQILHPDTIRKSYTLVSGLSNGKHQLELFKRTEWAMGKTEFCYFLTGLFNSHMLQPPPAPKRKLEVFGNSITCGYAVEDTTGQDRGTAPYENGYISYAAILARHYRASYVCTSKSGIGITISWFPLIMPEMYGRLNPSDSNSHWDFGKYQPDLVIINLFQNDAWLVNMPENAQFKARFGDKAPPAAYYVEAYRRFLQSVRQKYPGSKILCILGNMDATRAGSPWPGYVQAAADELNDPQIYTHFSPFKNSFGHPNAKEQQQLADDLMHYIDGHIRW